MVRIKIIDGGFDLKDKDLKIEDERDKIGKNERWKRKLGKSGKKNWKKKEMKEEKKEKWVLRLN